MTANSPTKSRRPGFSLGTPVALLVASAFFMENLDSSVVVTALPQMAASFGVAAVDLNIGVSAYVLTIAVLIPASGWVSDRLGARSVFAAAIAVFTLASVLCAVSSSLPFFVGARILQGAGGAMMTPVGRLVVLRTTEKQGLMRAIATLTWPGLAAPMLGPPVGGFITTYANWHWIFLLNLPLGLIGFVLALRLIPAVKRDAARPFDAVGFLLTSGACFGLIYSLDLISRQTTAGPAALVGLLFSLAFGFLAIRHARSHPHPIVNMWALKVRSYAVAVWGGLLFRMSIGSIPFMLPLLFQVGFGLTAFESGGLLLALFAGNLAMKVGTTAILRRFSFRATLLLNGLINAATIFACGFLTPATPTVLIVALLFISGLSRSMQFTCLNTLAFAEVPEKDMSSANTLLNMVQQMALGTGIALGALALRFAAFVAPSPAENVAPAIPLADFRIAFAIIGIVALLGLINVLSLSADVGDEIRGRNKVRAA